MTKIQYIKIILKILVNYINHIAEFVEKYNEGIKKICSKSKTDKIVKTKETIKYEKKLLESYEKAMEFYKELQSIADNCRWGMNVGSDIQWFCNRINSARLPIYERVTLSLITPKQNGVPTGGAAEINNSITKNGIVDPEFIKPFKFGNYLYYIKEVNNKLELEVGDGLRSRNIHNDNWSNSIRHQYVSAIYARNFGVKKATLLGNLNEFFNFNASGRYDTAIDKINNEIGREYALKYPGINRKKLLEILIDDYNINLKIIKSKLKNKGF